MRSGGSARGIAALRNAAEKDRVSRFALTTLLLCWLCACTRAAVPGTAAHPAELAKIRLATGSLGFLRPDGSRFVPFGLTYYRPGTGWAPQVWKKFDAEATRADFRRMKELGVNCVRVFLSYGSFYSEPGRLNPDGLARFDELLGIAATTGLYIHPTGPDHWEGTPDWAGADRIADEKVLGALETFWTLFAARYRDRHAILAYDLRNEPEVSWDNPVMHRRWNAWLKKQYETPEAAARAWAVAPDSLDWGNTPAPEPADSPGNRRLLDYQHFREDLADEWTRRQAAAIKAADPDALVTVGLIQWSVPSLLPQVRHYSGFRPDRQARFLDFLEVHFYPLNNGFYEYGSAETEQRNLAYLESVVREVARPGKAVVLAEFGWYGGGKPTVDAGRHPAASEQQQARWCRRVVETTAAVATGWLNWGLYDQPEATDVSQFSGLLTAGGRLKAWAREFQKLSARLPPGKPPGESLGPRPTLDWDLCLTSPSAGNRFREEYFRAWLASRSTPE